MLMRGGVSSDPKFFTVPFMVARYPDVMASDAVLEHVEQDPPPTALECSRISSLSSVKRKVDSFAAAWLEYQ